MRLGFHFLIVLLCFFLAQTSYAQQDQEKVNLYQVKAPPALNRLSQIPQPLEIIAITDSVTLVDKRGDIFSLAGIYVPESENMAAMNLISAITKKNIMRGFQSRDPKSGRLNRKNQNLAQLVRRTDNVWLQASLVNSGLAFFNPESIDGNISESLLKFERDAQKNKRGMWAKENIILSPITATKALYKFVVIEGKIEKIGLQRNGVYLNFGYNWKDDLTIFVPSTLRTQFARQNIQLTSLENASVRVRGFLTENNGPMITLNSTYQLEILDQQKRMTIPSPPRPSVKTP